ncbi:hypothetical protein CLTEP_10210 [Clostridium tepidiprofundi DSM 19306]|uniref:Uncharacterized protein n=1 Tax=Clostridium tepidiprofundi DSM 19306 TaxID=1121338 RepID=A0A151B544_9CLOT|nr:hypothetical protein CLTEP_10210 [Clostridium tepidiprofundi DSM 19306]
MLKIDDNLFNELKKKNRKVQPYINCTYSSSSSEYTSLVLSVYTIPSK